jgi:Flp pilus assembly protein TadD
VNHAGRCLAAAALSLGLMAAAEPAGAKAKAKAPPAPGVIVNLADIQSAMDEQRYLDAGRLIDRANIAGSRDPMVAVLAGELNLARGRFDDALKIFKAVGEPDGLKPRLMQDRGLALSMLGRTDEAFATLKQAVIDDPSAWRAWNALGGEYDRRRDWSNAEDAYGHAYAASGGAAIVLNNRGFSRVLQNRLDDGIADLVAALEKKPDLAAARTNLRLAMGLKGDYDRALASGPQEDKAALYNNVGYAALLRGDQARATELFNKALSERSEFYGRASNNLDMASQLRPQEPAKPGPANAKP